MKYILLNHIDMKGFLIFFFRLQSSLESLTGCLDTPSLLVMAAQWTNS
jgi:hypothetical protein